jgi:hypothetical protein
MIEKNQGTTQEETSFILFWEKNKNKAKKDERGGFKKKDFNLLYFCFVNKKHFASPQGVVISFSSTSTHTEGKIVIDDVNGTCDAEKIKRGKVKKRTNKDSEKGSPKNKINPQRSHLFLRLNHPSATPGT